jgi:hypothetical protein
MSSDVINSWWAREEFAEQRGDFQTNASLDLPGADLLGQDVAILAMQAAPVSMPPTEFEVHAVYDSRLINSYDFNFSGTAEVTVSNDTVVWAVNFNSPNGYRVVPREWHIFFDMPLQIKASSSLVSLTQNNAGVPNNGNIIVGMGTGSNPIKSFYPVEENTTFGVLGSITGNSATPQTTTIVVNCYGNLIAVTDSALQFAIADQVQNPA